MNRENLKIIVSAVLIVLVFILGIYVFIFRNELSDKIQELGKRQETEKKIENLILDSKNPEVRLEDLEKLEQNVAAEKNNKQSKQNTMSEELPQEHNIPDSKITASKFSDEHPGENATLQSLQERIKTLEQALANQNKQQKALEQKLLKLEKKVKPKTRAKKSAKRKKHSKRKHTKK